MPAGRADNRPFPRNLVRDLLGLARLLYRSEQAVDVPDSYGRLGRLEESGRAFRDALELERKKPGAVAAWRAANKGVSILTEIVRELPELKEMVRVAAVELKRD